MQAARSTWIGDRAASLLAMWIFLPDSFVSIVAHAHQPKHLLVRARRKSDLVAFVQTEQGIAHTPASDYAWRIALPRRTVVGLIASRLVKMESHNFKQAMTDSALADLARFVWTIMMHRDPRRSDTWEPEQSRADELTRLEQSADDFDPR